MSIEQEAIASLETYTSETLSEEDKVIFPRTSQKQLAWADIKDGVQKWRIWIMLAYQDIKLRYRRSVLGPFWLTLSMAITVYSMGFLYGRLFHANLQTYYPFLVAGMLTWTLISTAITELTDAFITSDGLIKQIKLPYSLYIHRVIARNILIFCHNLIVMIPIYILFHEGAKISFYSLLIIPGLALIYINAIIFGLVLAMIGARYRDGRIIKVYKFRTMIEHHEEEGRVTQATSGDVRITRLGKFLRRTSLDELPQFINVLQGRMSIVGPRPHALAHNELYKEAIHTYMQRHRVKPGITGWAQINGWRGETDTLAKMQKRVEYDLFYINNWSLGFDLKIIFLTLFRGFTNRNAY